MCVSISILISVAPSIQQRSADRWKSHFFDYLIFIVVAHYYNVLRPVRDCIQLRIGQQHILCFAAEYYMNPINLLPLDMGIRVQ
jgi:hypothetical protein